jgi:hypothetical protein
MYKCVKSKSGKSLYYKNGKRIAKSKISMSILPMCHESSDKQMSILDDITMEDWGTLYMLIEVFTDNKWQLVDHNFNIVKISPEFETFLEEDDYDSISDYLHDNNPAIKISSSSGLFDYVLCNEDNIAMLYNKRKIKVTTIAKNGTYPKDSSDILLTFADDDNYYSRANYTVEELLSVEWSKYARQFLKSVKDDNKEITEYYITIAKLMQLIKNIIKIKQNTKHTRLIFYTWR